MYITNIRVDLFEDYINKDLPDRKNVNNETSVCATITFLTGAGN